MALFFINKKILSLIFIIFSFGIFSKVFAQCDPILAKINDNSESSRIARWIAALKESDGRSQSAQDELIAIGEPAVPALLELLESEQRFVRYRAAWILGKIRDRRATPALIELLKTEPNLSYARGLGEIRDPAAIPALIEAMRHKEVKEFAMASLVQIGDPALNSLIQSLLSPNPVRGVSVAQAIGEFRDERAVWALLESLEIHSTPQSWELRLAAVAALKKIGASWAADDLASYASRESIPNLREFMNQVVRELRWKD